MISKKAQSEIITTVLIILLVLAAIVIVWQVVSGTMGRTKANIDLEKKCTGTLMNVIKATSDGNMIINRDGGNPDVKDVQAMIFKNGLQSGTTTEEFLALDQKTVAVAGGLAVGDRVKVAPFIKSDSYLCSGISEEKIVTTP